MPSTATIKAGEAFLELSVREAEFRAGLQRAETHLQKFGNSIKSVGRSLFAFSASATAALAGIIKLTADTDTATAAFTALTGSADKAATIIAGLQQFAGESAFGLDTLQGAARNLLNFGVNADKVLPIMRQLGTISAGDADRLDRLAIAFGQTQDKGRLMAEEVRQMVNAGFNPLQEIARTTGKSMAVLFSEMEKGNISAKQVADAFESVTGPGGRFHGLLEAIAKTFTGQFRKALAGVKLAAVDVGHTFLPILTDILKEINKTLPGLRKYIAANEDFVKTLVKLGAALAVASPALIAYGVAITTIANHPVIAALAAIGAATAKVADAFSNAANEAQRFNEQALATKNGGLTGNAVIFPGDLNPGGPFRKPDQVPFVNRPDVISQPSQLGIDLPHVLRDLLSKGQLKLNAQVLGPISQGRIALGGHADAISIAIAEQRGAQIEEAERLDQEIARAKIDAIKDDATRQKELIEFERQQALINAAKKGLLTPQIQAQINALAAAQEAGIKNTDKALDPRSTFSGKLAGQVFGAGGDNTGKQIAKNTALTAAELKALAARLFNLKHGFRAGNN